MTKNLKNFGDKLQKLPFLIIPTHDFHGYQFVYLDAECVDISIRSLIISQSIYRFISFNKSGYVKGDL